jgi:GH18 family chitinase
MVNEGNSGTTDATFSVTLSQATSLTVTVGYQTQPGTTNPASSGSDYLATTGMLTFSSGQTSKTINVSVVGDTTPESNETFDLVLNSPTNGTISTGTATCIINDDDSSGGASNRVVMAYAENIWGAGGATAVQNFDYSTITHVIHGFVLPDANGGLAEHANFYDFRTGAGWMPQNLPDAVHAAGRKIVFSIGGALPATNATNFAAIAADSAKRQTFINNVVSRLNTWGYDGVDIDYEWPSSTAQGQDFTTLMSELYSAVKANNTNHLVMFGAGPGDKIGYKQWSQLASHCDYCFFFGYDWHWGFQAPHPIGPITNPGVSFFPSSITGSIERSVRGAVNYVLGQGFPANQLVIGLPFYSDSGTTWSGGGRADWLGLTQAQRLSAINSNYMEALINGKYWTTPEAMELKLDALLDSSNTVLRDAGNNPVTVAGIGWWEWGNESPGHGELTAAVKSWLATNP